MRGYLWSLIPGRRSWLPLDHYRLPETRPKQVSLLTLPVLILPRLWFCLAITPPATRAVIYSGAKTAPAPAPQDPRCWRPLNIAASCGQSGCSLSRSLLADGCPDPAPPPSTQCARQFAGILHAICPHSAGGGKVRRGRKAKTQPQRARRRPPACHLTFGPRPSHFGLQFPPPPPMLGPPSIPQLVPFGSQVIWCVFYH